MRAGRVGNSPGQRYGFEEILHRYDPEHTLRQRSQRCVGQLRKRRLVSDDELDPRRQTETDVRAVRKHDLEEAPPAAMIDSARRATPE